MTAARRSRSHARLVIEVGDIREVTTGSGPFSKLMRLIERTALRRADLVVTVMQDMVDGDFCDTQRLRNVRYAVIENRVDRQETPDLIERDRQPETDDALTIGYFGVIRCERSWEALLSAARQAQGRIRVIVRGIPLGMPDFEQQCAEAEYVTYGGSFISPDDLPQMYAGRGHGLGGISSRREQRPLGAFQPIFRGGLLQETCCLCSRILATEMRSLIRTPAFLVDLHDIEGTAQAILSGYGRPMSCDGGDAVESRPVGGFRSYGRTRTDLRSSGSGGFRRRRRGCRLRGSEHHHAASGQHAGDVWKRHDALVRLGAAVKVMSFERPYYRDENRRSSWTSLGSMTHGRYVARIPALLRAIPEGAQRDLSR